MTKEKIIIGTLGPRGTYSEKAVKQWDSKVEIVYYNTIPGAIEAVSSGEVNSSIVPIENSLEGSINLTLDLLRENAPPIIGEIIVRVEHCLLLKGDIKDVTMIYSHPQALAQCRNYIRNVFPGIRTYETVSTADAAKKASLAKHIAAIASQGAAEEYGLKILAKNTQDVNENYTRFIVIGKEQPAPTANDDKTFIIVYPKENRPGAIYEILGIFADRGIDLTKIESRPTKKILGEYLFHIDLKGHMKDKIVAEALKDLKIKVKELKILGSCPIAKLNGGV